MKPMTPARRRAEDFHTQVENAATRGGDARFDELLSVVATLREAPQPEARPEFVSDLRARLMAEADTALAGATATPRPLTVPTSGRRERRLAAVVGGFAIVSATASMSVAAQSSLPGDTLYPLKRAIESAQTGLERAPEQRGAAMLDHASGRLDEVAALTRDGSGDARAISDTLHDFAEQADAASLVLTDDFEATGREESISDLREFASESRTVLEGLESAVPADARPSLVEAGRVLEEIDRLASALCPSCSSLPVVVEDVTTTAGAPLTPLTDLVQDSASALRDAAEAGARTTPKGGASAEQTSPAAPTGAPDAGTPSGSGDTTTDGDTSGATTPQPTVPTEVPASNGAGGLLGQLGLGGQGDKSGTKSGSGSGAGGGTSGDDPVGDLLTGTGELLEDVVEGVTEPLTGDGGLLGN
ncbi:MAG: hypothetical protein CMH83_01055 [Nocardioides sp.]|nr:hypothetical protein [Nocardioides sp.]